MEVKEEYKDKKRLYELILSQRDLDILNDLDSQGVYSNYSPSGARFYLLPCIISPGSVFRILPTDPDTYYMYVGDIRIRSDKDLEYLISSKEKIPIEMDSVIPNQPPINLGYVELKINKVSQM